MPNYTKPFIVVFRPFQRCIDYVDNDISWRSAARGHQSREGWGKQAIFELNVSISRQR